MEETDTKQKMSGEARTKISKVVIYGLFFWCLTIATLGSFGFVANTDFALYVVGGSAAAAMLAFITTVAFV